MLQVSELEVSIGFERVIETLIFFVLVSLSVKFLHPAGKMLLAQHDGVFNDLCSYWLGQPIGLLGVVINEDVSNT